MNIFSDEFMSSPAGIAAMAYAETAYASLYKSEQFTLADYPDMFDQLVAYHTEPKYKYCECMPVEVAPGLDHETAVKLVQSSVYVWLCNYKGEEDGQAFALLNECQNLSTYHGKWNYSD